MSSSNSFKRLLVVSYRLPFKVVDNEIVQSSGGLVSAMLALSDKMRGVGSDELYKNVIWVGKSENTAEEYGRINETNKNFDLVPVGIDKNVDDKYYGGFCNDLIWPLFHYFPSLIVLDESYFDNYLAANRLFAEKIREIARPDDFIWVHDYQLFALPALIRDDAPFANVGFFLHIPFPAFEIFRILPKPWRESILKGMLGADLVGFHTYDYSQYFLRTVSRLLGYEVTMDTVTVDGRVVKVGPFPLGIDFEKFNQAAQSSKGVKAEESKIAGNLKKQKLIFSVDRLDYSKGLIHRLAAFEYFIETYPEWVGVVAFNMVVIPSRDSIPRYQDMKREIEAAVGRINGKYGTIAWRPIIYQYKSLSFNELVALYDLSLVGLLTPIRDGMNLVAKEYVACQIREKGVLILSEMAGAAAELSEAILINPTDKKEVADALNKALSMPLRDRAILIARMQVRLRNYTVFTWAKDFLSEVAAIKAAQEIRKVNPLDHSREMEILDAYRNSQERVIFLDYDGTLVPFARVPELAVPSKQTMAQLKRLTDNPRNTIVLISGRDKDFLEEWFAKANVYLIAEHGAFQKAPGKKWVCTIDSDQSWKTGILAIMQKYTDRCNGSFIEEKFSSLAWHYRNSPVEIGDLREKELIEELRTQVSNENKFHVLEGNKVVEIKRTGYDKGIAANKFLADAPNDFIMALGDDRTDEDIFRSLPPSAITVKIGMTTSLAKYNLRNQREVSRFLDGLIGS